MREQRYPTGADVTAYMTEDRSVLPGPAISMGVPRSAAINALSGEERELDVAHVTVVEDGQVTPLYEFTDHMATDFMYSRGMVNIELQFNYSSEFVDRFRTPTLQQIRGNTLWLLMEKAQWWPEPGIIRDLVRIDEVYEHTMRHEPNPHASEQVPCTARQMTLVGRQERQMDTARASAIIEEGGQPSFEEVAGEPRSRYLGQVTHVVDGDTLDVELETGQLVENVRLVAVDTPETKSSPRQNDPTLWTWPSTRGPGTDNSYGQVAEGPSVDQLEDWGKYAKHRVKDELEGKNVYLVVDPGASPTDDPDLNPQETGDEPRPIFQVHALDPLPLPDGTQRDLGTWLVKRGLARARTTTSVGPGNRNRAAHLEEIEQQNENKAGTEEATGIFYAHDVANWDGAANDANEVTLSAAWEDIKNR